MSIDFYMNGIHRGMTVLSMSLKSTFLDRDARIKYAIRGLEMSLYWVRTWRVE